MRTSGTFRSIVVPLDGSPFAEQALPAAAVIARAARAKLRLVLVHQLPPPPSDRDTAKLYVSVELAVRRSQRDYLRATAARLRESHGLQVTTLLLEAPVGPRLARWIHDIDADLVVMTTHGRGAVGRAMHGSVADQLVRTLDIPVLLIRPDPERPAEDSPWTPREIVVGLDGSRLAESALIPAAALARYLSVTLTLVQVVSPLAVATDPPLPFPVGYDDRITEVRRREALDYLESLAERLRREGTTVNAVAVVNASPAGTLLGIGRPERGTLLALGTRGRGGVARLMLGSVADKLVREAAVPVLVVPPGRRK
jgi:nucleotide-binding universal stress UspA family protein